MLMQEDIESSTIVPSESIQIINTITFNWDSSCVSLATNKGFKIMTTQPLMLKQHRDLGAPLQFVQMFNRSNLLAFVGFENSSFVANRVAIFDDSQNNIIADVSFETNVMAVKIRVKKMIVALANRVYIMDFFTLEVDHVIPTFKFSEEEPYNMISMSSDPDNLILACPTVEVGFVLLVYVDSQHQRRIQAHQSILSNIAITLNGDKIASSSEKGMNIRIFNTHTAELLQEVRRGNEYGLIYSLTFSRGGDWLACTSDSDMVHVFASKPCIEEKSKRYESSVQKQYKNPKSKLYLFKAFLPFFDAQYSYCHYKMPDFESQMQSFVGFGFHDDSLMIINDYGSFKRVSLNQKGGSCYEVQEINELLEIKK